MHKIKIPTLLALFLICLAIILGIILFFYNQQKNQKLKSLFTPKDIQVVNITSESVTLIWTTNYPSYGKVIYGTTKSVLNKEQNDDRDGKTPKLHLVHFVTIPNLAANSTFFYQISNNNYLYPKSTSVFTTASSLKKSTPPSQNPALRGTVLKEDQPSDEALVILKSDQLETLATYTTTAGNFLLALNSLKTKDLSSFVDLNKKITADLEILDSNLTSQVTLSLPIIKTLPPIILGQDSDLTSFSDSPVASESAEMLDSSTSKYDLNLDGRINALDLSIVLDNLGPNPKDKRVDFNSDGLVDQKDVSLLEQALVK